MRIFKFLSKEFGLKSLYQQLLCSTLVENLNDLFDLLPYDTSLDPLRESILKAVITEHGKKYTMLCFSKAWTDPVI